MSLFVNDVRARETTPELKTGIGGGQRAHHYNAALILFR